MKFYNSFSYANITEVQDANHSVYVIYERLLCAKSGC